MAGVLITTISVIIFLTLFAIELVGFSGGPYVIHAARGPSAYDRYVALCSPISDVFTIT